MLLQYMLPVRIISEIFWTLKVLPALHINLAPFLSAIMLMEHILILFLSFANILLVWEQICAATQLTKLCPFLQAGHIFIYQKPLQKCFVKIMMKFAGRFFYLDPPALHIWFSNHWIWHLKESAPMPTRNAPMPWLTQKNNFLIQE